jgi:putative acetyltransferase
MYDAVHHGRSHYSPAQSAAWVPEPPASPAWSAKLNLQRVAVAARTGGPVGFMTLGTGGYIDLAYIAPDFQGSGLFRQLYAMIERAARDDGISRLTVHASLMAQPAFLAVGFRVIRHETVSRAGQLLARAEMEKVLK